MPYQRPTFLTAEWRWLAMLNYAVDPDLLRPRVPPGTELDAWNDVTYVSVVGFLFLHTRVFGIPFPGHRNFEEVNLRFYVRRKGPEGWRRGVVFVREIVPRRAVAFAARALYGEPYVALPMRHHTGFDPRRYTLGQDAEVEYGWRVPSGWNGLRCAVTGEAAPLRTGSEEEFITEHYWGYTARRGGSAEYRVEHPPWNVWQVRESALECDVERLYGPEFVEPLGTAPRSAFVAEGSGVRVLTGVRL
jgi:uncharacterized protein YqjF (DUF2071 family)